MPGLMPGNSTASFWTGMRAATLRSFRRPIYHNLNPAVVRPVNTQGLPWQKGRIGARLRAES